MTDKEKADLFMGLYIAQRDMFKLRCNIEWKLTIGLWSGIIVFTGLMIREVHFAAIQLIFYAIIWILFSFVWTWVSWYKTEYDKIYCHIYRSSVELLIGYREEMPTPEEVIIWKICFDYSRITQILITGLLLFLSWLILNLTPVAMEANG